jgi:hypothetical protein
MDKGLSETRTIPQTLRYECLWWPYKTHKRKIRNGKIRNGKIRNGKIRLGVARLGLPYGFFRVALMGFLGLPYGKVRIYIECHLELN